MGSSRNQEFFSAHGYGIPPEHGEAAEGGKR